MIVKMKLKIGLKQATWCSTISYCMFLNLFLIQKALKISGCKHYYDRCYNNMKLKIFFDAFTTLLY